jgi:hypothetical protein
MPGWGAISHKVKPPEAHADGDIAIRMQRMLAKIGDGDRRKSTDDREYEAQMSFPSPWLTPWYKSKSKPYHRENISEALVYFAFMLFYVPYTMKGLFNSDLYYLMEGIRDEYVGVEMLEEHAPTFGKTFDDIANVEEYYHWLLAGFSHTTFSPSTFNGDSEWKFAGGKNDGYMHGYNKFIGAVRLSQIRANKAECNSNVPDALREMGNLTYHCYGEWGSGLVFGNAIFVDENVSDFGMLHKRTYDIDGNPSGIVPGFSFPFPYDGMQGTTRDLLPEGTVAEQRAKGYSSDTTKLWNTYPSPSHAVTFDPAMSRDDASNLIKDLLHSDYIDLHTRALFVDVNLYNPALDVIVHCRMSAEITESGGIMTTHIFEVVRLYTGHNPKDWVHRILNGVVFLFYCVFVFTEYKEYKRNTKAGLSHFADAKNSLQAMNIFFFVLASGIQFVIMGLLPENVVVNGDVYNDYKPAVSFMNTIDSVRALNCFLNWFRLVTILNYVPDFGIMTETLSRAAKGVGGFMVIFFVVLMGFAQAYAIVFHARLKDFRTFGQVMFSLIRSLLGDFDYEELQDAHATMGPFLFILFTALAVFVVLNMLIAIISDAYVAAQEFESQQQKVYLVHEIKIYLTDLLWNTVPGGDKVLMFIHKCFFRGKKPGSKKGCCGKIVLEKVHPGEGAHGAESEDRPGHLEMRSEEEIAADHAKAAEQEFRSDTLELLKGLTRNVSRLEEESIKTAEAAFISDPSTAMMTPSKTTGIPGMMSGGKAKGGTMGAFGGSPSPDRGIYSQPGVPGSQQGMRPHDWLMSMRQELMQVTSSLKTMQVSSTLMKQAHAREVEELKMAQQQVVTELKASVVGLQQLGGNAVKKTIYCQQEVVELRESVHRLTEQHQMLMQNFVNITCNPSSAGASYRQSPQPIHMGTMSLMHSHRPQGFPASPMTVNGMSPMVQQMDATESASTPGQASHSAWGSPPGSPVDPMQAIINAPIVAAQAEKEQRMQQVEVNDLTQAHRFLEADRARIDAEKEEIVKKMAEQKNEQARLEKLQAEQASERARLDEKDRMLSDQNSEQIRLHQTIVQRERQVAEQTQKLELTKEQIVAERQQAQQAAQEAIEAQEAAAAAVAARRADASKAVKEGKKAVQVVVKQEAPDLGNAGREKELQVKLTAFYSRFNPAKLKTDKGGLFVAKAAQMYLEKQEALNQGLRAQYGYDLTTFEAAAKGSSPSKAGAPSTPESEMPSVDQLPAFVKAIR